MSRLVAMLLQAGALTPERAKEARGHQVVFGDRIGTNLLALGFVSESVLAQALGALHSLPFAAGRDADTKPTTTRSLPRQAAARLSVVPARVDDDTVSVFVIDPPTPAVVHELEAHYKRRIQPVIVCEARMWALLHKFYLVKRGMRALQLDGADTKRTLLRPRSAERAASSVVTSLPLPAVTATSQDAPPPPPPAPTSTPPPPALPLPAATSTAMVGAAPPLPAATPGAPHALRVVDATWLRTPPPLAGTRPRTLPPLPTVGPRPAPLPERAADARWLPVFARPEEAARFDAIVDNTRPAPTKPPASSFFAEADLSFDELVEETLADEAVILGELVDAGPPQETSPLTFDEAREMLARVTDRNAIARIVLRYAMSRVRRALLLTVQRSGNDVVALGWDALGEGLRPGVVHDILLSLAEPSVLQLARENRAHVLGPLARTPVNDELVGLLGGPAPRSAFVMPILANRRVVNLLYLDDGPARQMVPDIGEVLILCQHINKSYDALLSRAQA